MGKKFMLAVAMLALVAAPAFASVQNVKVSGAITTTSFIRNDFNTNTSRDRVNEILGQTTLDVSADLTDNVSTKIGLFNERYWGNQQTVADQSNAGVDIETAYVTMKELLYSPLTLTVGRQPLVYGNQLVIGSNTSTKNAVAAWGDTTLQGNFDAIKAVLSYDPLTVDLFASRINNRGTVLGAAATDIHDNVNLYGINANYKFGDKMSTVVEAYTFLKQNDMTTVTLNKSTSTYVPGLRVSTNPIEGLNVQLEGAYQMGKVLNSAVTNTTMDNRAAYAFQGFMNYALPVAKSYKPVVSGGFTYLSGSKMNSTKTTGWDQMFINQNCGRIFHAKSLDLTNAQIVTVAGEMTPMQDVTTKLSWNGLWLAQKSAYNSTTTFRANSSKYLGSELDLDVTYAYTEDVKFGLSAGAFLTGKNAVNADGLADGLNNKNATQLLTSVSVAF